MPGLLQMSGGQPQKQPRYAPIFIDRTFTGIWTQRSPLHDPSDIITSKFYGGRPDALWDGLNVELTNRLTLQRRPGLTAFSAATYPTPPIDAFSFELTNGTIQVIVDTGNSPLYQMAEVDEISGVAFYHFFSPQACAANNAYAGLTFSIKGFDNNTNNGTFVCTGSTVNYLILTNPNAATDIANSSNATAQSAGGVYYDPQAGGIKYLLFSKQPLAGQTGFVAVAGIMYAGDGVDTWKYTPGNTNGTIANSVKSSIGSVWNYSIAAPTNQPAISTVASGASAVAWQASTFFSTMGLLVDANSNIQFLTGVNNTGTNTTNFGTTGQGQPTWSNITGVGPGTGTDGSCHWLCAGPLKLWAANTKFTAGDCIYVPGVGGTPIPSFSQSNGNNTGSGVTCPGTTGGGVFQAYIQGFSGGQTATSGASQPNWNPTSNTHTQEIGQNLQWQYLGPAQLWKPSHTYNAWWEHLEMCIVEPALPNVAMIQAGTQQIFVQTNNNQTTGSTNVQGTSGTGYAPPWPPNACSPGNSASVGQTTGDGDLQWICLGCKNWTALTNYTAWLPGANLFSAIVDGNGNFQVAIGGGSSASVVPLNGFLTSTNYSNGAVIAVRGPSGWVKFTVTTPGTTASTPPAAWNYTPAATTTSGGVVFTSNGTLAPSVTVWGQTYGAQTNDGTVVWVNVGTAADSTWTSVTQWYYPAVGFAAPTASNAFAGPEVIANGDVQIIIASGLTGSSQPAWGAIGTTTQDNFAVWYTDAVQSTNSLAWTKGHVYAYSYKSRLLTDFYSQKSYVYTGPGQSTLTIPIPPGLSSALPAPTGAQAGGISESSPVFTIIGANTGAVNSLLITGSLDPQVDTIVIWRDADGGGPSEMFELTEIPNPKPVNGAPGVAVFQDFLPDVATLSASGVLYPGLNNEIAAPTFGDNNPPPTNFIPMVYNFQRIWGAAGQTALWSGGPDITNGSNANECYFSGDAFPYLANITRIMKNSQGLIVFLTDSVEFIGGGPQTASFYTVTIAPGIGMNNFNAADLYAGEIFFISADSQMKSINPSLQLANLGFAIGDKIAAMNSSKVQMAVQQAGVDNAVYLGDGSTGWWRLNPHQIPQNEPIWSPFAAITNGAGMVQSVEVTPGAKRLLVGGTGCNQQILQRDLTVYTDAGSQYDAFFVMGSIMLCHPGQLALLKFIEADFSGTSYQPQISYLLNEINSPVGTGTFLPMSLIPVFDPPSLYGTTITPVSYSPNRYYFASTGKLARARHMQIKVDFGTTAVGNEIHNLTIFGRLMVEN